MRTVVLSATGRRLAVVLPVAAGLLVAVAAGPALAAAGVPQRPAGPVVPVQTSVNGGDNGWGNCGHNSSGGAAHSGFNGAGGGNGGYLPGELCARPAPTDTGTPTPTDTGAPTTTSTDPVTVS